VIVRVVLIDDEDGWHRELGQQHTDEEDLTSLSNRGLVIKLIREHPGLVKSSAQTLLVDLDDGRRTELWQVECLLRPPRTR
jgi:hypothetical protein